MTKHFSVYTYHITLKANRTRKAKIVFSIFAPLEERLWIEKGLFMSGQKRLKCCLLADEESN